MEEKIILKSNNDYAKELKKKSTTMTIISVAIFFILMLFFNDNKYTFLAVLDIAFFAISVYLMILATIIEKTEIVVSDKRVYGATSFGKRVDLPFDSISAIGISAFNGVAIGTSSGKIVFKGIGNRNEIHDAISKLLVERQEKRASVSTTIHQEASHADELKKYKDLLDSGIITQEEFDAKKKQLLGL